MESASMRNHIVEFASSRKRELDFGQASRTKAGKPDLAEAEAHVLAGGSLAVLGYAGTGKSHWGREVVKKLRADRSAHIIAKTWVACTNLGEGCVTADHWVRKYARRGSCPCDCLVIEEFSQISA